MAELSVGAVVSAQEVARRVRSACLLILYLTSSCKVLEGRREPGRGLRGKEGERGLPWWLPVNEGLSDFPHINLMNPLSHPAKEVSNPPLMKKQNKRS